MQKKGYVSFVLHAHLPFIHHPESDDYLEESWLYEAISETYIPLLQNFQKLVDEGVKFRITMSITPTLLSMLDNKLLQKKYINYLNQLIELSEKEIDTFIEMRINQLREEGAKEDIDLKPALKDYYLRHMSDGTFVSWLAMDGETIVGTSGMSFVEKPPYFGCASGKMGLLSSMFTNPDYRRMGIAKELLDRVVNEARLYGCGTIQITASDMGVKLYTAYGFVHNDNFMQYKL